MSASRWDLKLDVAKADEVMAQHYECIPMGFETSSFAHYKRCHIYYECIPMGFETKLENTKKQMFVQL